MQGAGTLMRLLRAERNGLLELHLIAVCETIPGVELRTDETMPDTCLGISAI